MRHVGQVTLTHLVGHTKLAIFEMNGKSLGRARALIEESSISNERFFFSSKNPSEMSSFHSRFAFNLTAKFPLNSKCISKLIISTIMMHTDVNELTLKASLSPSTYHT